MYHLRKLKHRLSKNEMAKRYEKILWRQMWKKSNEPIIPMKFILEWLESGVIK